MAGQFLWQLGAQRLSNKYGFLCRVKQHHLLIIVEMPPVEYNHDQYYYMREATGSTDSVLESLNSGQGFGS